LHVENLLTASLTYYIEQIILTDEGFLFDLQGYVLLLLRNDASLLGLGYLALLIATFLNPPLRGEFEEKNDMGRVVTGPDAEVTKIYKGCWSAQGNA